jgi:hypothetical protein
MSEFVPLGSLPLFAAAARDREHEESRPADPPFLIAPETPLERRFAEFHKANPQIYRALARQAEQLLDQGRRRIAIAELVEELRYHEDLGTRADPFKLNNSHRAFYSRLLIYRNRSLEGVIEIRTQHQGRASS